MDAVPGRWTGDRQDRRRRPRRGHRRCGSTAAPWAGRRDRPDPARRRRRGTAHRRSPGRRAARRGSPASRLPSPRSCRHRHGSSCSPPWVSSESRLLRAKTQRSFGPEGGRRRSRSGAKPVHRRTVGAAQGTAGQSTQSDRGSRATLRRLARMTLGSRPALVGQDGDRDVVRGAASGRPPARPGTGPSGRAPDGRRPATSGRRGRTGCAGWYRAVRSDVGDHRGTHRRRRWRHPRTGHVPNGRRSSAVVAIEPAPPAAVTTEVNGTTEVPSDRSMAGQLRVGAEEPVAAGQRAPAAARTTGRSCASSPSGPKNRSWSWSASGAPPTRLGDHPEDQVVRVRVVPLRARPGVRLAEVLERPGRVPDAAGLAQEGLVDPGPEVEVTEAAGVVEQLADRDPRVDREGRQVGPRRGIELQPAVRDEGER